MNTTIRAILAGTLALAAISAHADVIVHGTRVIFPGNEREVSVRLENRGKGPVLVQTWTDDGDQKASPEAAKTPFVLRPPVFRLNADKSRVVRMQFAGAALPQDRESLYWFNALEVPPVPKAEDIPSGNFMQFAMRTRLKIFYRPNGLSASAAAAAHEKVRWTVVRQDNGWALEANNPTPYYVNYSHIGLLIDGKAYVHPDIGMVAPQASTAFALQGLKDKPAMGEVQYVYVNDQGANVSTSVPLTEA